MIHLIMMPFWIGVSTAILQIGLSETWTYVCVPKPIVSIAPNLSIRIFYTVSLLQNHFCGYIFSTTRKISSGGVSNKARDCESYVFSGRQAKEKSAETADNVCNRCVQVFYLAQGQRRCGCVCLSSG